MSVISFEFVIPIIVLTGFFFYLPGTAWRRVAIVACNAAFLWLVFPDYRSWIAFGAFVLSGYFVGRVLERKRSGIILGIYLTLLVVAFMVLKRYALLWPLLPMSVLNFPIIVTGLSYLLFRQIHFLVDVLQGQIERPGFWAYLNYQANLFGFFSGPIQRFQEFDETWANWEPALRTRFDIIFAYGRMFAGYCKIGLSALVMGEFVKQRQWFELPVVPDHFGPAHVLAKFLLMMYSYPVYLYLNFSGYCDVVIAAALLIGIKMPENFDRPYLSRNMIDYWTRFHRSLGFWIRDYLFTPMYKFVAERWNEKAAILVFPCYFIAFVLAGVWHGSTMNFAVFGVLHGCGASANKIWEYAIVKRSGRKGLKNYLASTPIRLAAIALTLTFVSFTMLFFPHDLDTTQAVFSGLIHRL